MKRFTHFVLTVLVGIFVVHGIDAQTSTLTWSLNKDTLIASGNEYLSATGHEPTRPGYSAIELKSGAAHSSAQDEPQFAKDRVLVKLANTPAVRAKASGPGATQTPPNLGIAFSELRLLNPSKGNVSINNFSTMSVNDKQNNMYVLTLEEPGKDAVERALKILNANPAVEIAEPVFYYKLYATPNDPRFSEQYALAKINAMQAWDITPGSQSVVVGIIDSGIEGTHPDLVDNLWVNPNPNQGGYENDIHGYDFVYHRGGIPTDKSTHGTHVAGIVGAKGNNGIGVTGINWNVSLAWLGAGIDANYISIDAAIEALNYANNHDIRITNNSWGGGSYSALLEDAIRNYNGLFVAAAGNDGTNNDRYPQYPAGYNLPNVISVASTDQNDNLSSFSNFGTNSVHIAAPGSNILSTLVDGQYEEFSGTSMASPHVAGVAALMLSANPNSTAAHLKNTLINCSDNITISTPSGTQNIGRLNALKATQGILTSVQDLTYSASGHNVTLNWREPVNATGLLGYKVYREATLLTPANISALTYTDTDVPNGIFTYTVTAVYANGQTVSNSISVTAGYIITITTQPVSNTVAMHGSITGSLSTVATVTQGIPLSYQWYSNSTYSNGGGTPIGGATNATFDIPATLAPGTYYYFCEVSATGATSVRSNIATVGVAGIGSISYLDENGNTQNVAATTLTGAETTLTSGWYFVPNDINYSNRLTISTSDNGVVVIILGDNAHMSASNGGINVGEGNNLRIYAQSAGTGMGRLTAFGGSDQAGIGGDAQSAGGTISIIGGVITAYGGGPNIGGGRNGGAGIGGGGGNYPSDGSAIGWSGGTINISGGIVSANGSWGGSGIGCGGGSWDNTEGAVSITGGTITVRGGGFFGFGIAGGTITTISGNTVLISSSGDYDHSILPPLPRGENLVSAIVYDNGMGTMYGNVTLARNVSTPSNSNLFICNDQTLTIQAGYALTNDGTIVISRGSVVGTVIGNQPITPVFTISGGSAYDYSCSGVLTITGNGTYTIGMRAGVTTTTAERIVVLPGVNANITLSDVKIDMSSNTGLSAFDMMGATVNLTFIGENMLRSGGNRAGLEAPFGSTLVITEASTGSLTTSGGSYGAGIGGRGGYWTAGIATCGNISIAGGTVTTNGGFAGAGIGDGQYGQNTAIINISGGTIRSTGGDGGAGIGGGQGDNSSSLEINISGGTVTAVGISSSDAGPGIGASGIPDITINISGGVTTSIGGANSAGIGGGGYQGWFGDRFGQGATINITGGVVNAKSGGSGTAHDIGVTLIDDETAISKTNISITGGSVFAANSLITDKWPGGISRYPVKVTVVDSDNNKIDSARVMHSSYTEQVITGGNYANADFNALNPGVAWLWLPEGSQTIRANKDTYGSGSNTANVLTPSGNNVTVALTADDIAVDSITDLPTGAFVGIPLTLTGTVNPASATRQTIKWSVGNAGTTGAVIIGNTFYATMEGLALVLVTITDGVAIGTDYIDAFFITVKAPTGIKNTEIQGIKLFPNPVKDELYITSESRINKVEIYNANGTMLIQENNFAEKINVSSLAKGVYMARVYTAQDIATVKIIKD